MRHNFSVHIRGILFAVFIAVVSIFLFCNEREIKESVVTETTTAYTVFYAIPVTGQLIEIEPDKVVAEELGGVLTPSNLTSEELEKGLMYNLKDYADTFIRAEKETGVNAVFLSSVSALESGWGTSKISQRNNNLFGWTSKDGYYNFNSKEESIMYVAEKLKQNYLTPDARYFSGYEVEDVNTHYNGSDFWENEVNNIMEDILDRIEREVI